MKVLFTGAQGTGKTSVMEALPASWPKIQGVTRKTIAENNLSINKDSTNFTQKAIFDAYKRELFVDKDFISERSLIDVLAFTRYQYITGKTHKKLLDEQYDCVREFVQKNPDALYIYFPIEFAPKSDGQRSTDPVYQAEIDNFIHGYLNDCHLKYIRVSGSVKERCQQIQSVVNFE